MLKLCQVFLITVFVVNIFTASNAVGNMVNNENPIEKMERLQLEMNSVVEEVETEIGIFSDFINQLPDIIKAELHLNDLLKCITDLNIWYGKYEIYAQNITQFENLTLENFAEEAVSHASGSVSSLIGQIHALISPAGNEFADRGILGSIASSLQNLEKGKLCSINQSPQQFLYNMHNYITLAKLKGYMMMQFSYMILKLCNKGTFTSEAQIFSEKCAESNAAMKLLKRVMRPLSREVWKCDPKYHVQGETYEDITQFLQGYIQNEADLNSKGWCTKKCAAYTSTRNYGCIEDLCKSQQKCNGEIINCRSIEGGGKMDICLGNSVGRNRYDCIKYFPSSGIMELGCKKACQNDKITVESWQRGFVKCDYCFCFCDEEGDYSDRYFSLRPVMADIENNRVVTGLRFVKKNRIIHFQIQEGKLLSRGNIDMSTIRWIPVEDYKITDKNISRGRDYHALSFANRWFVLDDLMANEGHVITGIRFSQSGSYLSFAIHMTAFDFLTGQLVKSSNGVGWKSTETNLRTELHLEAPDVPILSVSPSLPDSEPNEYIQFTHTDLHKDAAQNAVPYLDAQPVESLLPVPLGGAGIYHKGQPGYGGFVAPKIITYDFTQHMESGTSVN